MNISSMRSLKLADVIVLAIITAAAVYLYAGFFSPDPYILSYGPNPRKILWIIRIVLPILYIGLMISYIRVRSGRIQPGALLLMAVTTVVCLCLSYMAADFYYQRWFDRHRPSYHPYLQLVPPAPVTKTDSSAGDIRVYCLGGSTTELPDSSGIDWPSRVESIFHYAYGMRSVRVYNLGREWYTSLHTLINYETNLREKRPAVILYMEAVNDLLQNADFSYFSRGRFRDDYGHFYGPVNRIIDRRTLWRYLSEVVSRLWYSRPRRIIDTGTFPGLAPYRRNIQTLIDLARSSGSTVVLMTEPCLMKQNMSDEEMASVGMLRVEAINDSEVWSPATVLNGMEEYNGALRDLARDNHLCLIDLEKEVPKSLTFFRDEVHYRDTAFSVIAPFVAERLHECISGTTSPPIH
jgi:uncharacterized membrane protein YhaH (DUF805 family)